MKDRRDAATVSVKFGAQRGPDGAWIWFDGRPAAVKTAAAYSLQRLGLDHIDVYRPARLDPSVPIEDTIGAIAWVLAKGDDIIPLVGARRRDRLAAALGALDAVMTPQAVAALEAAVPKDTAAGDRYPPAQMASLDSERRG